MEPIVTIGIYVRTDDGSTLRYIEITDCLYCPEAGIELYPTRAAFQQLGATHHFDDVCQIWFRDGTKIPFESSD